MLTLLIAFACTPKTPAEEPAQPPATEAPTPEPAAAEPAATAEPASAEPTADAEPASVDVVAADGVKLDPAPFMGAWTSPSCGARTYARNLTLADGSFSGSDLVSPCPPKARCVWSGVVAFSGTWAQAADGSLTLTEGSAESGPGAIARPPSLHLDAGSSAIYELDGSTKCAYTRGSASTFKLPQAP